MLQRIQSVYLLLVLVVTTGLIFVFNIWKEGEAIVHAIDNPVVFAMFIGSALLALIAIFSYKKRQNQFVINRLNIILNLILLGFFVYKSQNLSGGTVVSEKGIGMLLPLISIVLLALANKAIKKDEDLVKSVDRLR